MRGSKHAGGALPGAAAPVVVTRSTFPPSNVGLCGRMGLWLSPVVTYRKPSGPNRIRPPLCKPAPPTPLAASLNAMLVMISVRLLALVYPELSVSRITRFVRGDVERVDS